MVIIQQTLTTACMKARSCSRSDLLYIKCVMGHDMCLTTWYLILPGSPRSGISVHMCWTLMYQPYICYYIQPYNKTGHIKEEHILGHSYKLTWCRCEKVGRGERLGEGEQGYALTQQNTSSANLAVDRASYPQTWMVCPLLYSASIRQSVAKEEAPSSLVSYRTVRN